jgi:hypothetical protein
MFLFAALVWTGSCGQANVQQVAEKNERMPKVSQELTILYGEYSSHTASHRPGTFQPSSQLVRVIDDRVVVDAVAAGEADVLKSDLESLGMRQAVVFGRIVSGELPIVAIPAMGALPTLNFARAASALLQGGAR